MSDMNNTSLCNYAVLVIADKNNKDDDVKAILDISGVIKSEEGKFVTWIMTTKGSVKSSGIEQHIKWICNKIKGKEYVLHDLMEGKYYISITFFSFEDSGMWSDVIGYETIQLLHNLKLPLFLNNMMKAKGKL